MTEPVSSSVITVSATGGITVLGLVTGLHPALMLAGAWGGWWALSYQPAASAAARLNRVAISSIVAAYSAPVGVALALSRDLVPGGVPVQALEFAVALAVGLVTVDVLGRSLMRWAAGRISKGEGS